MATGYTGNKKQIAHDPRPAKKPPLTGPGRDAYAALVQTLSTLGLGSLASKVLEYVQAGLSEDSIMLELQGTPEWKARFAANEARRKAGLPVLTPAEYLATETSYRQIMRDAGVPAGFYDQTQDFTAFLENDVSPAELQTRVKSAADFVLNADPQQLAMMKNWYTTGDLIAYALDPKRAAPLIEKAFKAASIGGIASDGAVGIGRATAEALAGAGISDAQARQGFNDISQERSTIDLLSGIDGQKALTADELAQATFLGDAASTRKLDKLKSRERGRFGGSSGVGQDSLSKSSSV